VTRLGSAGRETEPVKARARVTNAAMWLGDLRATSILCERVLWRYRYTGTVHVTDGRRTRTTESVYDETLVAQLRCHLSAPRSYAVYVPRRSCVHVLVPPLRSALSSGPAPTIQTFAWAASLHACCAAPPRAADFSRRPWQAHRQAQGRNLLGAARACALVLWREARLVDLRRASEHSRDHGFALVQPPAHVIGHRALEGPFVRGRRGRDRHSL